MSVSLRQTSNRESQTDFKSISTVRKSFGWKFREFCESSTLHGVLDCYKAESPVAKLLWISVFCGALTCAIYGCSEIIHQYRKSPVVISYIVHREDDRTKQLPNVIICPFGRFNSSFFRLNHIDSELIEHIQKPFFINTPYRFFWNHRNRNRTMLKTTRDLDGDLEKVMVKLGNISYEQLIELASFKCEDLIDYCVFAQRGIVDCCRNATAVMTPQSKCYRLRGSKQESSGFGFGMTIVIRTPSDSTTAPGLNLLHNNGVSVKIAEPQKGLDSDLTFIPTGVHALMPLKATRYEFMNDYPRYECWKHVSPSYSYTDCVDQCVLRNATLQCHCRSLLGSSSRKFQLCSPKMLTSCFIPHVRMSTSKSLNPHYFADCKAKCKQPCDYWTYQPTISYAKFPANSLYDYITDGTSEEEFARYIILDIFYEKLEYTIIKHYESMPNVTFIANLGGQVGLWVGGSILSIAQVICFLIGSVKILLHQKLRKIPSANGNCQREFTPLINNSATQETWLKDYNTEDVWHKRTSSCAVVSNVKTETTTKLNGDVGMLRSSHNHQQPLIRRTHSCQISCV